MAKYSQVVIVGRMNVGKSTLFNRLSTQVKSLTLDYEGVTRDFVRDTVCWQNTCFELVDSGGISLKKSQDLITEKVRQLALDLVKTADLILFVCDGSVGPTLEDTQLAKFLHKEQKKVILVINKGDDLQKIIAQEPSFAQLGFSHKLVVSALHGKNISDLLEFVIQQLPKKIEEPEEESTGLSLVILGKPNVGKSSLMNLLIDQERMIVADIAGTTREAITEPITFYKQTVLLTDTPGLRRKRAVEESIEKMMVKSAFHALDRGNIVVLLIDGDEGIISDQELKLAFYAFEQGKGLMLVINKADLITPEKQATFDHEMLKYQHFFKKIPALYISCKTKKNIGKIIPMAHEIWQRYNQKINDYELTTLFKQALEKTPLYHSMQPLVLNRVQQIATAPMKILLHVNRPTWFGQSQLSFFENVLRKEYDLDGVPVIFIPTKK